ncbi:hypothetical protein [Herbaspirillum sp. YR522]|uniref:hypothetical protein n=1 Tax=Herbaspirillum sp. YR522 TaxID=1144342 RepID=UPI00026FCD67|nr:hypothetical protein [Herbaspirillum sp. YR522]EJN02584.1 hypothetical protein PMI40_03122 [Herbaspirillum sp. YR522]
MHFVSESVPGEITLMFISYLLFCTVLMYLFVKTDREWGRLEVSLDEVPVKSDAPIAAMLFSAADAGAEPMYGDIALRQSLRHCATHHQSSCSCFLHAPHDTQG